MPFPPQGPQGPMGFGQPRPPLMGYGGMLPPPSRVLTLKMCPFIRALDMCVYNMSLFEYLPLQRVDLLTRLTNLLEAEATMTTSVDKVATWVSHAASGKSIVRTIFIL